MNSGGGINPLHMNTAGSRPKPSALAGRISNQVQPDPSPQMSLSEFNARGEAGTFSCLV